MKKLAIKELKQLEVICKKLNAENKNIRFTVIEDMHGTIYIFPCFER